MTTLFWVLVLLVLYTYMGYPLLVLLRAMLLRRPYQSDDITPRLSVLIACHNEEAVIEEKLRNLLAVDYPRARWEVIVASDGSTDRTNQIVDSVCDEAVRLLVLPRCGKAAALNAAAKIATGEIFVFTDANSLFEPGTLRALVRPFADPQVGGVAGDQVCRGAYQPGAAGTGERWYWGLERVLKRLQSRAGNAISATGSLYAIRQKLFREIPEAVTDDFVTSTRCIAQGYRLVFEPGAVCHEPVAGKSRLEFDRKVRVITRGLRGVFFMRELLNPWRFGAYSLQLFSQKILRRLAAVPLMLLLLTSLALWNNGWGYRIAAVLQIVFYGVALLSPLLPSKRPLWKPLELPFFFCLANAAALVAVWNTMRGTQFTVWEPTRSGNGHGAVGAFTTVGSVAEEGNA